MKSKLLRRICAIALAVTVIGGASISTGLLSIQADAAVQQLSLEETIQATETLPDVRPTATNPILPYNDEGIYRNGTFTVPVYMYSAFQTTDEGNSPSMANAAIVHDATVNIKDGNAFINLKFNAITLEFGNGPIKGHLMDLWFYDKSAKLTEITEKEVEYYYPDLTDLSQNYTIIDNVTIPLWDIETRTKPAYPSDIRCRVSVDAMGDIQQDCYLVIDWQNLKCEYWNDKVSPLLNEYKTITNDDNKYTDESYQSFVDAIVEVENSTDKYDPVASKMSYDKLIAAKTDLIVVDEIFDDGIYEIPVRFLTLDEEELRYPDGTSFGVSYNVSKNTADYMTEFFGTKAELTRDDGIYTLKITPQVDKTSEYYIASISGTFSANSYWLGSSFKKSGTTAVDYFGKSKKVITTENYCCGNMSNKYNADRLIVQVSKYSAIEESASIKELIAISLDWDKAVKIADIAVDKTALDGQVGAVENLFNSGMLAEYTDTSVANLQTALEQAKAVNENENATQEEVDAALANLQNATKALEKKPTVDTTALETKVAEAEAISNTDGKYTEESYAALTTAVESAKAVLADESKTQESVDNAVTGVQTAIEGLVEAEVEPVALTNTAAIDSDTIQLGTSLTVNMGAEGGEGDYTYSVLYKKAYSTKWAVAQKPTTDTAATVKPAAAGQYYVMVKVKDASGNVAKKCFVVNVENNLKNTSALSADSIKKGESVTVNAAAEGTTGDYQYAVMYKKLSSDKWAVVQKYDANTEITFTPAAATEYEVCVKARDNNGAVAKKYFIVSVTK